MHAPGPSRWPVLLGVVVLACLVCAVFFPMLRFEFIDLDVPNQVTENRHIGGLTWENVKHILTSRCVTSYYPVRTLSYAVDYQLWGLSATGFKLTNGLMHLTNVLLVFWLVFRLFARSRPGEPSPKPWWEVSVATFSAGVFAVHPVVVEPVVWVSGREELLMTLGALACLHFYLTARRLGEEGGKTLWVVACYVGSTFFCAAACLSNAVGAVIPLLIVAWELLGASRPKRSGIVYGGFAFLVISVPTIAIKKLGDISDVAALADTWYGQWLMLISRTYWLNLKTLLWPTNLALSYECFPPESFFELDVVYGFLAVGVTCVVLWKLRRRRMILLGLAWFGLALGPSLQIVPHHVYRSDRFLYLPLVGLIVAVAMGLRLLGTALKRPAAIGGTISAGVLILLGLHTLSSHQLQTWQNSVSLWEHCLSVGPQCAFGHQCFATTLTRAGRFEEAIFHYQLSLLLDPEHKWTLNDYASQLATWPDERLRDYDQAVRVAIRGCQVTEWNDPELRRTLALAHMNFATSLKRGGRFDLAIENYQKAIDADPGYEGPLLHLAWLLATCSDRRLRDHDRAILLAKRGCRLTESQDPQLRRVLALAYMNFATTLKDGGRLDLAIENYNKAIEADPDYEVPLFNLALLLATCSDQKLRQPDEAVRLAERASELIEERDAVPLSILAQVYAETGRFDEAIATAEKAIELAEAFGDSEMIAELKRQLDSYRVGRPFGPSPD